MNRFVASFTDSKEATLTNSDLFEDDKKDEPQQQNEEDEGTRPDDDEEDEDAYLSMDDDQDSYEFEDLSKQHRLQYKYSLWYVIIID